MRRSPIRALALAAAATCLVVTATAPAVAGGGSPVPAPRSPVGEWSTRMLGVKQTITFTSKGEVFGSAGCNRFTGSYTTDGQNISIGPLATTMMMCEESVMGSEATFLTRLQAAVAYDATAKRLKVFAPKDILDFRRI